MVFTHAAKDVYEFKNTGIILMKTPTRFLGTWALVFTTEKREIITFSEVHYMKHTSEGLVIVASTFDALKVYTIQYQDHNLQSSDLDLYEWILSIIHPTTETRRDESSSQS